MQIHIDLPYDLETTLREQAQRKGKALNQYIISLISEKANVAIPKSSALSEKETQLFTTINKGFSEVFWKKIKDLNKKRQDERLSEMERQDLIALTEQLETANLERMKALVELAHLKQTDLDILMSDLGLIHGKHY